MQDDLATNRGDAAEVREDLEVTGLRLDRHLQAGALVTTTIAQPPGARGATNERVELGRYTISAGERIRYGQRVLGVVRLVDVPAEGRGRRYIIERGPTCMAERSSPTTSSSRPALQLPGLILA